MKHWINLLWYLLVLLSSAAPGQTQEKYIDFKGKHLLVLSDADMLASGYITGDAGPFDEALQDQLALIDLSTMPRKTAAIKVSNSVKAWPSNLAVTPDGKFALVAELYGPGAPNNRKITATANGRKLSVISLQGSKLSLTQEILLGNKPNAIEVRPQNDVVVVSVEDSTDQLAFISYDGHRFGKPVKVSLPIQGENKVVSHICWHPSGKYLALSLTDRNETHFFSFDKEKLSISPFGNSVFTGKVSGVGYFTPNGKHFVVTNLLWGEDVAGYGGGSHQGMLTVVAFDTAGTMQTPAKHEIVSTANTGGSPENFAISPDGAWIVSLDMEQSYFPPDSPYFTPYSGLTLFRFNATTGKLSRIGQYYFEGILPEGITFDASGKYLAVAVFDHHHPNQPGGTLDFWRLWPSEEPKLIKMDYAIPLMRGAHMVKLIP